MESKESSVVKGDKARRTLVGPTAIRDNHVLGMGGLPFLPLVPVAVVLLSLGIACSIGFAGIGHLTRVSEEHAALRADLFVSTLGTRIEGLSRQEQIDAMRLAARRTGDGFLLTNVQGDLLVDASVSSPDRSGLKLAVLRERGMAVTAVGKARFAVHKLQDETILLSLVRVAESPESAPGLVKALVALAFLLVTVAAFVGYAVAQDAHRAVLFMTQRVRGMSLVKVEPTGEPLPIRSLDEVGGLTSAFNELVDRFAIAKQTYQEDLRRVHLADRDRAGFLAAVSHELRSPLNAILGFADILMAEVDGPISPGAREEIEQIRASGQHLLELINDILEFSAIEGGQLRLVRRRVDASQVIRSVLRELLVLVGDKPITVEAECDEELHVYADPKRARQIVSNLVGNAIKFTLKGRVVIRLSRSGPYARITVTDTGPGIREDERKIIFDEYKQSRTEQLNRRGTGLGLAIARRLVLMHGGNIQVESEVNVGSSFHVYLPIFFDRGEGDTGRARETIP